MNIRIRNLTIAFCLTTVFLVSTCAAQQQTMPYLQRVELAKKFLKVDRDGALADPTSSERASVFTPCYALIDPGWTADFILENPIVGGENIAYEDKAILKLLSTPSELSADQVLGLIGSAKSMKQRNAMLALKNLPDETEHAGLRQSIVDAALPKDGEFTGPLYAWNDPVPIARHSNDPADVARMKALVEDYYRSGKAEEDWKQTLVATKDHPPQSRIFSQTQIKKFAPEDFDLSFLGDNLSDTQSADGYSLYATMTDANMSDQQKSEWLASRTGFDIGGDFNSLQRSILSLGLVAKTDLDLALKWAESANNPTTKILAELVIAPSLAKRDPAAAIAMVRQCYKGLLAIDPRTPANRSNLFVLNHPPAIVAAIGLRVADHLDAKLLNDCVDQTITMLESSKLFVRGAQPINVPSQFKLLARIARYDRARAKVLFDKMSDEVQTGYAPEFFRAMVAIQPDQVWAEYESYLEASQDDKADLRVRMAIVPALVEKNDDDFWNALLLDVISFEIPEEVFED